MASTKRSSAQSSDEQPRRKRIKTTADKETEYPNERQVRLKPYNPRGGHKLQTYSYRGAKFLVTKGWYTVPLSMALYLESVHQDFDDPSTPKAFDVCTREEADEMASDEFQARVNDGRARPGETPMVKTRDVTDEIRPGSDPDPVTTGDLVSADLRRKEEAAAREQQLKADGTRSTGPGTG